MLNVGFLRSLLIELTFPSDVIVVELALSSRIVDYSLSISVVRSRRYCRLTLCVFADSEFIVGYLIVDLIINFGCRRHPGYFVK